MDVISNDEAVCLLPDGRFRLEVHLDTINGKLVDSALRNTPYPLYFDWVTLDGTKIEPTSIEDGYYIYEYEVPRDGAVIGVWYHMDTEQ